MPAARPMAAKVRSAPQARHSRELDTPSDRMMNKAMVFRLPLGSESCNRFSGCAGRGRCG